MKTLFKECAGVSVPESESHFMTYERVLMMGLYELEDVERKAIFLRFWSPSSIEQISSELKVSWNIADQIINRSIGKLRTHFINHQMELSPFKESRNI